MKTPQIISARFTAALIFPVLAVVLALPAAAQYPASFTWRNTTLRGDNYQSHNQTIVWTANGLFRSGDQQTGWPSYHPNDNVIVERSTDGGATWSRIFDTGVHRNNLKPVTVEADEDANVYLIYPNSGGTRFVKFSASNNYASAVVNRLHTQATSASKFASFYDQGRQRLLHATQSGYLFTFDRGGNFVRGQQLFQGGSTGSRPSYPHLFVDESGIIHYALTVADAGDDIPYETIRYLKSLDGGQTWKAMNGSSISIPTTSNPNGPSTMINLPGEENYQTWLAAMHVKNGKAHFAYRVRNPANPGGAGNPPVITEHTHYMRFNVATGVREIDSSPNGEGWQGNTLRITDYSASFASDPDDPDGPLYAAGKDGGRLNVLISHDNGTTWQDYARSGSYSMIANPGLYRQITPDGKVIGCVATSSPAWATVNFFSLPDGINTSSTTVVLDFDNPQNTHIGNGTLQVSDDGSGLIELSTDGSQTASSFAMTGGLLTIDSDVTLRNGGWQKGDWSTNRADLNVNGTLDVWDGSAMFADALTGAGTITKGEPGRDVTLNVGVDGGSGTFSGTIGEGAGAGLFKIHLAKTGSGTQTLSGTAANTYSGTTTLSAGKLVLGKSAAVNAIGGNLTIAPSSGWANAANGVELAANEQIADSAVISFTGSDWSGFRLKGFIETVGGLSAAGKGVIENSGGGQSVATDGTLIINIADGTSYTYNGYIRGRDGGTSPGKLNLTKTGLGTQILTSNNITYTGTTTINQGRLKLSHTTGYASPTTTVGASGTLELNKTATGPANRATYYSPGTSPGAARSISIVTLRGSAVAG